MSRSGREAVNRGLRPWRPLNAVANRSTALVTPADGHGPNWGRPGLSRCRHAGRPAQPPPTVPAVRGSDTARSDQRPGLHQSRETSVTGKREAPNPVDPPAAAVVRDYFEVELTPRSCRLNTRHAGRVGSDRVHSAATELVGRARGTRHLPGPHTFRPAEPDNVSLLASQRLVPHRATPIHARLVTFAHVAQAVGDRYPRHAVPCMPDRRPHRDRGRSARRTDDHSRLRAMHDDLPVVRGLRVGQHPNSTDLTTPTAVEALNSHLISGSSGVPGAAVEDH